MVTKRQKIVTYLIAYFLLLVGGALGIHRIYLRKTKTGILMLVWFLAYALLVGDIFALGVPPSVALLPLPLGIWVLVDIFLLPKYISQKLSISKTPEYLPMLPKEFVIFDLETTGLDPDTHEIIEIGAIKATADSTTHDSFQAFIKLDGNLPKEITKLTGITQEMLDEGDDFEYVIKEFVKFIGDLRLVAFNAPFDMGFLKAATQPLNISIANKVSDPLDMMRRAYPDLESYKLRDLAKTMQLKIPKHHRAVDDCKLTAHVYATAAKELNDFK